MLALLPMPAAADVGGAWRSSYNCLWQPCATQLNNPKIRASPRARSKHLRSKTLVMLRSVRALSHSVSVASARLFGHASVAACNTVPYRSFEQKFSDSCQATKVFCSSNSGAEHVHSILILPESSFASGHSGDWRHFPSGVPLFVAWLEHNFLRNFRVEASEKNISGVLFASALIWPSAFFTDCVFLIHTNSRSLIHSRPCLNRMQVLLTNLLQPSTRKRRRKHGFLQRLREAPHVIVNRLRKVLFFLNFFDQCAFVFSVHVHVFHNSSIMCTQMPFVRRLISRRSNFSSCSSLLTLLCRVENRFQWLDVYIYIYVLWVFACKFTPESN